MGDKIRFRRFEARADYDRPYLRMEEDHRLRAAARRQREFIERCQPYVRIMCDLRDMQAVQWQVKNGCLCEMEVLWREKDKQMYDQCQEMIDQIRSQYQPGGVTA